MSIYHLRANETITNTAMLQDTEVNFVSGERFRLRALRERVVEQGASDKDKFDTNLTIEPTHLTWVSNLNIEGARMTRQKLHYDKTTGNMRKLFSFNVNCTVQVDYANRGGQNAVYLILDCETFENFFAVNFDTGLRDTNVITYVGSYSNGFPDTFASPQHGQIRCFGSNVPQQTVTIVLQPNVAFPATGTDVWYIQFQVDVIDSQSYPIDRAS